MIAVRLADRPICKMMMRCTRVLCAGVYNFGPGPAVVFPEVMKRAQKEFTNFYGTGCPCSLCMYHVVMQCSRMTTVSLNKGSRTS